MPEKKQQLKQYLQKLLKADFEKWTTSPLITKGNCKKIIGIAEGCGLDEEFVEELKSKFKVIFNVEYKTE